MPLFISFYTPNYKEPAEILEQSCKEMKVKLYSRAIESVGSWKRNCAKKADFVLEMLKKEKAPVVWVDADAQVIRYPELFQKIPQDFSAYWPHGRGTLWSGTLFMNYTPGGLRLAEHWAGNAAKEPCLWDQRSLSNSFLELSDGGPETPSFLCLPQGYCRIWDQKWHRNQDNEAYIIHHQYSRKIKKRKRRGAGYDSGAHLRGPKYY